MPGFMLGINVYLPMKWMAGKSQAITNKSH
jgi:hypothetical protein